MTTHPQNHDIHHSKPRFIEDDVEEPDALERKRISPLAVITLIVVGVVTMATITYMVVNHQRWGKVAHQEAVAKAMKLDHTSWVPMAKPLKQDWQGYVVELRRENSPADAPAQTFVFPPNHPSVQDGSISKIVETSHITLDFWNDESLCQGDREYALENHLRVTVN